MVVLLVVTPAEEVVVLSVVELELVVGFVPLEAELGEWR